MESMALSSAAAIHERQQRDNRRRERRNSRDPKEPGQRSRPKEGGWSGDADLVHVLMPFEQISEMDDRGSESGATDYQEAEHEMPRLWTPVSHPGRGDHLGSAKSRNS